jgi:hypothetical protein
MKISIIGNCQAMTLADIIQLKLPDYEVSKIHVRDIQKDKDSPTLLKAIKNSDFIFSQPLNGDVYGKFAKGEIEKLSTIKYYPRIIFLGYHPDCIYLNAGKPQSPNSPIGRYHSAIAVLAFKFGFTVEDTCKLFNPTVFNELGYIKDFFEEEILNLKNQLYQYNIDKINVLESLFRSKKMMHTTNHPKIEMLDILSSSLLNEIGIDFHDFKSEEYIVDKSPNDTIFPLYPGISEQVNERGNYIYKASKDAEIKTGKKIFPLESFISHSFDIYKNLPIEQLVNPRFSAEYCQNARKIFNAYLSKKNTNKSHPYTIRKDYSFWKKAISTVRKVDVDPVVTSIFNITKGDKIATAGSCFAQHIANRLSNSGFNYFVTETPPQNLTSVEATVENYGVFSARFGNVYTTRQMLQLFDRAFGNFTPNLEKWQRPDGKYVDQFRPQISKHGYEFHNEVISEQNQHLKQVKRMFQELDVFVFTLGLTEAWMNIDDGSILPIAPGVIAGDFGINKYKFVNFTKDEVAEDLKLFLSKLNEVNKKARVLLTVSPVPLMATYEDRHVLVSTTISKAILRVVAEEISKSHDNVTYFPSYEIITGNFNQGTYFEDDLREVNSEGVDHVMKLFLKHCTTEVSSRIDSAETEELNDIVCDEEVLDI